MEQHAEKTLCVKPKQAARMLGISVRYLWALTKPRGPIPSIRLGSGKRKTVLYSVESLREWLAKKEKE